MKLPYPIDNDGKLLWATDKINGEWDGGMRGQWNRSREVMVVRDFGIREVPSTVIYSTETTWKGKVPKYRYHKTGIKRETLTEKMKRSPDESHKLIKRTYGYLSATF